MTKQKKSNTMKVHWSKNVF